MKKITLLILLITALFSAKAQETPPAGLKSVNGQFYINLVDSAIWHNKGTPYGWERLARYKDIDNKFLVKNGGNNATGPQYFNNVYIGPPDGNGNAISTTYPVLFGRIESPGISGSGGSFYGLSTNYLQFINPGQAIPAFRLLTQSGANPTTQFIFGWDLAGTPNTDVLQFTGSTRTLTWKGSQVATFADLPTVPTNYWTTNTSQTGLTGNKTTSGSITAGSFISTASGMTSNFDSGGFSTGSAGENTGITYNTYYYNNNGHSLILTAPVLAADRAITYQNKSYTIAGTNDVTFIGTTSHTANRASGAEALTGISIDGQSGSTVLWGGQTANFSAGVTSIVNLVAQQPGGAIAVATLGQTQGWLGLGSNAYTSTAYLPLAGGTLSGDITVSKNTSSGAGFGATNANAAGYSSVSFINSGASGKSFDIGLGGSTSATPNNFYIYNGITGQFALTLNQSNDLTVAGTGTFNSNLFVGNVASSATATPTYIKLDNTFSNGVTDDKLKVILHDDGLAGTRFGFSVGSNTDMQYFTGAAGTHDFYIANAKKLSLSSTGITVDGNLSASLPTYASGTFTPVIYNTTNSRFEKKSSSTGGTATRYTASGTGLATTINVPHGLSGVTSASAVLVQPMNLESAGDLYVTIDATNVNIVYSVAPASGEFNLDYSITIKP